MPYWRIIGGKSGLFKTHGNTLTLHMRLGLSNGKNTEVENGGCQYCASMSFSHALR